MSQELQKHFFYLPLTVPLFAPLQVRFVLLGGTEDVQASLSNQTVARILPLGGAQSRKLVHVSSLAPGEASLTATDEGLHHHRTATATVCCLTRLAAFAVVVVAVVAALVDVFVKPNAFLGAVLASCRRPSSFSSLCFSCL